MKILFAIILTILLTDPKEIAKINALKKEAESAYLASDYATAIAKYTLLKDSIGVDDPAIHLNLAHAYFHLNDTTQAKEAYETLVSTSNKSIKSIAYQQLGVMSKNANKLEKALEQLKAAIKADPSNQGARYDYEVVKKLLEKQKQEQQQNQDQQNQDQQNQDQQNQDQQNQDQKGDQEKQQDQKGENQEQSEEEQQNEEQQKQQEEGDEQEQEQSKEQMTKEKLEEMGISEEKARQLLEAMRQSEIKYLQHQRRKATKRPPSNKPDW